MFKEIPSVTLRFSSSTEKNTATVKATRVKLRSPKITISHREQQVLQLMADGKSSKQIADALTITTDTVESHRKSLYKKINVNNATEAVAWGFRKRKIK